MMRKPYFRLLGVSPQKKKGNLLLTSIIQGNITPGKRGDEMYQGQVKLGNEAFLLVSNLSSLFFYLKLYMSNLSCINDQVFVCSSSMCHDRNLGSHVPE